MHYLNNIGEVKMSELYIRVTKIGHRWHARLLKGEDVLDEMACISTRHWLDLSRNDAVGR